MDRSRPLGGVISYPCCIGAELLLVYLAGRTGVLLTGGYALLALLLAYLTDFIWERQAVRYLLERYPEGCRSCVTAMLGEVPPYSDVADSVGMRLIRRGVRKGHFSEADDTVRRLVRHSRYGTVWRCLFQMTAIPGILHVLWG